MPRDPSQPAGSLILVDTSTYDRPPRVFAPGEPRLHLAAGETGGLGPAQLRLLEDWVAHAASQGRAVIVAGHHPYGKVDPAAQAVLSRLIEGGQVATYSAPIAAISAADIARLRTRTSSIITAPPGHPATWPR